MQASFKIHTSEFSESLIKQIVKLFQGQTVTITVSTEQDETVYLLSDPENKKHLSESMASEQEVIYTPQEFEEQVGKLLKENSK